MDRRGDGKRGLWGRLLGRVAGGLRRLLGPTEGPPPQPPVRHFSRLLQLEDRALPSVTPLGAEFRVNTFTAGDQRLFPHSGTAVATSAAGNSVVVWSSQGQDGNGWGVFGQRFDPSGNPQGTEFRVNTFTANDQQNAGRR